MLKVIGVGDNVVDCYLHTKTMYPGGNALNFSVFAKKLGYDAAFLGTFGSDDAGEYVPEVLESLGVDISHCRHVKGANGRAKVMIQNGDRTFMGSNKGGVTREHPLQFDDGDYNYLQSFDLVHTSTYSYINDLLPALVNNGNIISYDFSHHWDYKTFEERCPYIAFSFFSTGKNSDDEAINALKKAVESGSKLAITTRGERGSLIYDGDTLYAFPAQKIEAVDTMAAGDSFITAFLTKYLSMQKEGVSPSIEICSRVATEFASQSCLVEGSFGYGKKFHYDL